MTETLQAKVSELSEQFAVPGVAVGVLIDGDEQYAFHGVTSIENPLPVDESTLFQFGSTGKTFTATAMLRLVEQGSVSLDEPVRKYVPELNLKDEDVAARVTVRQLFNHTAGWSGDLMDDTGNGDDALEKYVENMARIEQVTPLGSAVSYNNASLCLAGRVIEKVTGKTYEQAIRELIFEPLGLEHCFFFEYEIMTRRFVVGHSRKPDGTISVARPWALPRGSNPAGGISSNAGDQIRWAKFHLGDGEGVLSTELLKAMQEPTAHMPGSAIGDAVGISWLLQDVGGVRLVKHGGTTIGQHSEFVMVPERNFAVIALTNAGPNGPQFNDAIIAWALKTYLGVEAADPEPVALSDAELEPYTGTYQTIAALVTVTASRGGLDLQVGYKPETLASLGEDTPPMQPPYHAGLLGGPGDRYVITEGPGKAMKGYFARDESGRVSGVHLGGRLATRT